MHLFRILLLIGLILLAIPFFNMAKDYVSEKSGKVKAISETTTKFFRYKRGEENK